MSPNVRLYPVEGGIALESPFDAGLVAGIKALPYSDRKWDAAGKRWIVAPACVETVIDLVDRHLGVALQLPGKLVAAPASPQIRMVKLEYLGRCKQRDADAATASGYADGSWTLVFPESVLRAWFLADTQSEDQAGAPRTLYQVLAVKPDAPADDIKKAYRRLAFQTHPDRNKEPVAVEQFRRLQSAYDVLRDERLRTKYDAGLTLEASTRQRRPKNFLVRRHDDDVYGYRSPLRCGLLLVEATPKVGQWIVSKILKWEDVVDDRGRTMVSSWPLGADRFEVRWY